MISFSFRRQTPRLIVIYVNLEEEEKDPLDEAPYDQRIRVSKEESGNLWYILPPRDAYIGVSFVIRLTRTDVIRQVMVCCLVW